MSRISKWRFILGPMRTVVRRLRIPRFLLNAPGVRTIRIKLLEFEVPSLIDRQYLTEHVFPSLCKEAYVRVLFVGCRRYTRHYGIYFTRAAIEYWTTDIDPSASVWGEQGHHIECDIRDIDRSFPAHHFDVVFLNGVFGFGVDSVPLMNEALQSIHRILRPSGILMIGWNTGLIADPLELTNIRRYFMHTAPAGLPKRKTFESSSHVYDFFKAIEGGESDGRRETLS